MCTFDYKPYIPSQTHNLPLFCLIPPLLCHLIHPCVPNILPFYSLFFFFIFLLYPFFLLFFSSSSSFYSLFVSNHLFIPFLSQIIFSSLSPRRWTRRNTRSSTVSPYTRAEVQLPRGAAEHQARPP